MRITREFLHSRVQGLNMMLERPMSIFGNAIGTSGNMNVGHLMLDVIHESPRKYMLVEITSKTGGERGWSSRMTGQEMQLFLDGIVKGMTLRNSHIGELMMKSELDNSGLGFGKHSLYSDELRTAFQAVFKKA